MFNNELNLMYMCICMCNLNFHNKLIYYEMLLIYYLYTLVKFCHIYDKTNTRKSLLFIIFQSFQLNIFFLEHIISQWTFIYMRITKLLFEIKPCRITIFIFMKMDAFYHLKNVRLNYEMNANVIGWHFWYTNWPPLDPHII